MNLTLMLKRLQRPLMLKDFKCLGPPSEINTTQKFKVICSIKGQKEMRWLIAP